MQLGSDRTALRVRLATVADAPAIASIYAPWVRETAISFEHEPPSRERMAERIAAATRFYPWLVVELDGEVAGYAYASRLRERPAYDWIAETSVYVARDRHRAGLGRALYAALLDVLRLQGVCWAYGAIVVEPELAGREPELNPSQRFHASVGFEPFARFPGVGFKLGRWWDTQWWRLALADASPPPAAIRSIHDPGLRDAIAERLALDPNAPVEL